MKPDHKSGNGGGYNKGPHHGGRNAGNQGPKKEGHGQQHPGNKPQGNWEKKGSDSCEPCGDNRKK